MTTPIAVGIDLGTTNSLVAFVEGGRPVVVRDAGGAALVPSCLSFHPDGTVLVGTAARDRALSDPEHTVFSVKRLMGRTLADLEAELKMIPHPIVERDAGDGRQVLRVRIGDREHTPEELSALILKEVRKRAGNPTKAVITVPAYFDDAQRQATRDAGRIAGLDVLRIVNEPTAAALAYGLDKKDAGTVAVYDLGGGTFDCSILKLSGGVFKVLSTNGDTYLGGDDIDRAIMQVVAKEMGVELDGNRDVMLLQQLRDAAEKVKIALSDAENAEFVLGSIPPSPGGRGVKGEGVGATNSPLTPLPPGEGGTSKDTKPIPPGEGGTSKTRTFTRVELEVLLAPFVDRSLDKCKKALRDAGLTAKDIDEVVLVGGSTRIPYVRQRVAEFFGRTPHTELNPDEVVALGAAVQADILTSGKRDLLLLDVVPLSLGLETLGGVVDKVIDRNSTVPCQATTRYTTYVDNQTAIIINIYQGERELVQDCRLLGKFKLGGIPPMPAQFAQVDVTFLVDANGQLTVSAVEKRSGVAAKVEVTAGHGLSPEEVEKMVMESVEHAHADFTTRRLIELRNKADADLRAMAKVMADVGDQLTAGQRAAVESASTELRTAMAGEDVDALQRASAAFNQATIPPAELQMNAIVKKALAGKAEGDLDAGNL